MQTKGKHWLKHTIVVSPNIRLKEPDEYGRITNPNFRHSHVLKVFDYPADITRKWDWYIDYWLAKFQIRFPRHKISHWVMGYWPEAESDTETQKKREISAAKGQISKVLNVMEERRKELSIQLFKDETNDPIMIKCREKLEEKKFKLEQLLMK